MIEYAEQSVIGSLLTSNGSAMDDIPHELDAGMFLDEIYASAFAIYQAAYEKSENVGVAYVTQRLVMQEGLPQEVIEARLKKCLDVGYSTATIGTDAKAIIKAYKARQLGEILNRVKVEPEYLDETFDYLSMEIDRLNDTHSDKTKSLAQIVRENKDNYFKQTDIVKIEMEFATLNDLVGGFEGGDMIVIGARPAVGKSAFATQLASHFSEIGKKVGYFNLEMPEKQIYERFLSSASGIGLTRIRRAINFTGDEKERFDKANEVLEKKESIIITTGSQTITGIKSACKNKGYDLIIIDYLQLIKPEGRYKGNRFAEVGEISHSLKAIATDLMIPVIVLSQLNRVSMARDNKEPTMSELRESGDIEQDASVILLLWNLDEDGRKKGCKIEKNRQGKTGMVTMQFNGDLMKFEELTDKDGFEPVEETPFSVWEG